MIILTNRELEKALNPEGAMGTLGLGNTSLDNGWDFNDLIDPLKEGDGDFVLEGDFNPDLQKRIEAFEKKGGYTVEVALGNLACGGDYLQRHTLGKVFLFNGKSKSPIAVFQMNCSPFTKCCGLRILNSFSYFNTKPVDKEFQELALKTIWFHDVEFNTPGQYFATFVEDEGKLYPHHKDFYNLLKPYEISETRSKNLVYSHHNIVTLAVTPHSLKSTVTGCKTGYKIFDISEELQA